MTLKMINAPSPNHDGRRHPIDMLVLHYTGMADGPSALERLQDPSPPCVSAHYMVAEDGTVFALVAEDRRAWHAGQSAWQGEEDLNSRSIGVEIVNGGHDFGLPAYPQAQITAVIELCRDIVSRQAISATRIVGHSDIAPDRKEDPGERFPWRDLASAGIGLWPDLAPVSERGEAAASTDGVIRLQQDLSAIGYRIAVSGALDGETQAVVRAFQRRWRPEEVTGVADADTWRRIAAVSRLFRRARDAALDMPKDI
ncbi:MAG: N-acetylmuramoyl-L-alanine amidase [Alphaproteobacteria bacterium]|nr:N-acetylmuramoyl-L-alanine amidase [Alphaproteobacteria bacterium]